MTEFKLGRNRPIARPLRFSLNNYLRRTLPPVPNRSVDLVMPARDSLARVYMNDKLSCCTASAAFHIEYLMLAAAGQPAIGDDNDVIKFYSGSTGYDGTPKTDLGGDEQTVLNYWREHGLVQNRRRIAGHILIDATDTEELRAALYLFENLYFGIEMPRAWVTPQPRQSGFIWDIAGPPDYNLGHAFAGIGAYDERGVFISTWGMVGLITWRAIAYYGKRGAGGEIHTVLSPDSLVRATKKTPHGFDWSQLVADFDSAGGDVRAVLAGAT